MRCQKCGRWHQSFTACPAPVTKDEALDDLMTAIQERTTTVISVLTAMANKGATHEEFQEVVHRIEFDLAIDVDKATVTKYMLIAENVKREDKTGADE